MDILRILIITPILTILPGAWISFGLPLQTLGGPTRLAIGIALSPAVLGVQLLLLKLLGVDFAPASILILLLNLPGAWLILRSVNPSMKGLPKFRISWPVVLTLVLFAVLVFNLVLPWFQITNYRQFSWHALMHTDIIYQLTQHGVLPEEPEIAGLHLAYPWLGHVYWAVLGWLANWSPTQIYPISNFVWLATAFFLAYQVSRKGFDLSAPATAFGVGLMFMGSQMIALSARLIVHDERRWVEYFGYRIGPLLEKYRGFETMPFAFALLLALLLLVILSLRQPLKFSGVLIAGLLVALGIVYPVLLPVGCILVGFQMLLLLTGWSPTAAHYRRRHLFALGFACGMALLMALAVYLIFTRDTSNTLVLATANRQARSIQAVTPLLILLMLAAPVSIRGFRQRDGASLLLAMTALCLMGLSVIVDLGGMEYKFVYVAPIVLAPLCAASVNDWFVRSPRTGWALAVAVPVLFVGVDLLWISQLGGFLPDSLPNAPRVAESHFWIELGPTEEDASWINSIRDGTPADTVVLTKDSPIHVGPFVRRSLYAPSDQAGEATAGYSMANRDNLIMIRRYPARVLMMREAALEIVFTSTDTRRIADAMAEIQALNRPVAIHYSSDSTASLIWLRGSGLGFELLSDGNDTVWFISSTILGAP